MGAVDEPVRLAAPRTGWTLRYCRPAGPSSCLAASSAVSPEVVTVLFSDIVGSTALGTSSTGTASSIMAHYFQRMESVSETPRGNGRESSSATLWWPPSSDPRSHEDDAFGRRADRGDAAALHASTTSSAGPGDQLMTRTGLNTGEVIAGEWAARRRSSREMLVNMAARLEQVAPPGEILVGEATYRWCGTHSWWNRLSAGPEGHASPGRRLQAAGNRFRCDGMEPPPRLAAGWRPEWTSNRLIALSPRASGAECRAMTVLGPAGIGKSRPHR